MTHADTHTHTYTRTHTPVAPSKPPHPPYALDTPPSLAPAPHEPHHLTYPHPQLPLAAVTVTRALAAHPVIAVTVFVYVPVYVGGS